jgi:hypothetical protein
MREQEVRNLWEAYLEVCENQQLDENVQGAVSGALKAGADFMKTNPVGKAVSSVIAPIGKGKGTVTAPQQKQKISQNEEVEPDLFDTILEHLVAEGYADTNESALVIMANMSEEWRQSIVEGGFNSSGRYDVGGGRTVGPVAGAVRSLFSGNLPKGQTYVPPSPQKGTNRPPAVPSSKNDSGKLTDFGAGGGKAKLKTGMSVGQVERQGRRNKGDYSG